MQNLSHKRRSEIGVMAPMTIVHMAKTSLHSETISRKGRGQQIGFNRLRLKGNVEHSQNMSKQKYSIQCCQCETDHELRMMPELCP
jgi:hypothetical protein